MSDLISRQAVIDAVKALPNSRNGYSGTYDKATILGAIEELPSAERTGKWIYEGKRGRFPTCKCSVCGNRENADWAILGDNVNYCPNCGARMGG